jgi:ATP-binding cassette subfamily B protein/ATP-binding cassette subfamily C protein
MKITKLLPVYGKLFQLLSRRYKLYLFFLTLATIGLSAIETFGISVIMPFISIASNPALLDNGWYKKAFDLAGFASKEAFIAGFGIGIIAFYFFRAIYSVAHIYSINRFSHALYNTFSANLFKIYLSIPYKLYAQKNSAEFMQIVTSEASNTSNLILSVLQMNTELFTVLLVYALMLVMNWKITLVLTAVLIMLVMSFIGVIIKQTKAQGTKRIAAERKQYRILRETFGNFKFVRLKGNEKNIIDELRAALNKYARSRVISNTLGIMPKSILESVGFSLLVAAVIVILKVYTDPSRVIPIISMYALALYRILPALHRMLQNINDIVYKQKSLDIIEENLHLPVEHEGNAPVDFEKSIVLENISFKYVKDEYIINNINIKIKKGEKIAITGESGGGKTTLVDLIIGIHKPAAGNIYIDDIALSGENIRDWRRKIGYIPQSIYLFDGTVAENVAFGSTPDETKIIAVLKKANIWDFLSQKDGINTLVGEGGIQLSGGQQQRIGIARALYDDPDVLVLDEATSALDTETEAKIMDEIYNVSGSKTLIVIAHRLSTVERCYRKIHIEKGNIVYA